MWKKVSGLFMVVLTTWQNVSAQVEMADSFRADGKIYVVIAVIAVILGGMVYYLFRTESRVAKLEKIIEEKT